MDDQKEAGQRMKIQPTGLYDPGYEHDACGVGYIVNIDGDPSHAIIEKGIAILENLSHRGATGADENTGDGAGIMIQVPDAFLRKQCKALKITLPKAGDYGVGMFFLPQDDDQRSACMAVVENVVEAESAIFLGWREVPCDGSVLGEGAQAEQPVIMQAFRHRQGRHAGCT